MKILSLGAGVQSSTIFLMGCYGELQERLGETFETAIFADTGWEPKAVYKWFKFLKQEGQKYGVEILIVNQGDLKADTLKSHMRATPKKNGMRPASLPFFTVDVDGKKGMVKRQCTYDYKIKPIERKARELSGYKPRQRIPAGTVEMWKGISTDEIKRATLSQTKWIDSYYPLIEMKMSRQDCLNWFERKGLPMPPRSACLGCPFHSDNEWRNIKEDPDEWQDTVMVDNAIRKKGGLRGDLFLHAARIPLNQVDLTTLEDHGQMTFDDECAGVCGV